jgi:F-type H+-transporting ATPase subunit a
MITNLFSVFDPVSSIGGLSLNWGRILLFLVLLPSVYWFVCSRKLFLVNLLGQTLRKEIIVLLGASSYPGNLALCLGIFSFLFLNNVIGLIPYVFTGTSHISVTFSLALIFWVRFMLWGWVNNRIHMFIHLVPQGTPSALIVFIVVIETVSNLIRPLTLSVRLAANIIAGHLLLTLLGDLIVKLGLVLSLGIFPVDILLLILELAVAIIQSYVFLVLVSLYAREVN